MFGYDPCDMGEPTEDFIPTAGDYQEWVPGEQDDDMYHSEPEDREPESDDSDPYGYGHWTEDTHQEYEW